MVEKYIEKDRGDQVEDEKLVEMNFVEGLICDIKTILMLLVKFIWYKITFQNRKAVDAFNWMKFFWYCKPDKRYKVKKDRG